VIKMAFELFASGRFDQDQVLRRITAEGLRTRRGKKLSKQTFSALLRKPIYAGRISLSCWDIDKVGDFAPIVSENVFCQVQEILAGRRVPTLSYQKQHPDFPLRHFVRCARCDKPLTGSLSKGRSQKYPYYKCLRSECKLNVSKTKIEEQFIALMKTLQPRPQYLRLFEAIVLDVWKEQRSEANKTIESLTKRLDTLRERLHQLTEAFVYDKSIDRETYQAQLSRLRENQVLVEIELNESKVEELDIESALNFALFAIGDASRFWFEASIEQKQGFQRALFPDGLAFDGQKFETAKTCLAFTYLREISSGRSSLASRTGIEPVSPP
jgi:site-specific DNA recombinase